MGTKIKTDPNHSYRYENNEECQELPPAIVQQIDPELPDLSTGRIDRPGRFHPVY
jgi:hypothetical protein